MSFMNRPQNRLNIKGTKFREGVLEGPEREWGYMENPKRKHPWNRMICIITTIFLISN